MYSQFDIGTEIAYTLAIYSVNSYHPINNKKKNFLQIYQIIPENLQVHKNGMKLKHNYVAIAFFFARV